MAKQTEVLDETHHAAIGPEQDGAPDAGALHGVTANLSTWLSQLPHRLSLASSFASFSFGFTLASLGAALVVLKDTLHADSVTSLGSVLFMCRSIGGVLGSIVGAPPYDYFRGNHVVAVSLLLIGLCTALIPAANNVTALAAVLVVQSFCVSVAATGHNVLLLHFLPGKRGDPHIVMLHLAFAFGATMGPLVLQATVSATGSLVLFHVMSGSLFLIPASVQFFTCSMEALPRPKTESGKTSSLAKVPSGNAKAATGDSTMASEIELQERKGTQPLQPASVQQEERSDDGFQTLAGLHLCAFLLFYVATESSCGAYLFSFGVKQANMSDTSAAILQSCVWAGLLTGRLVYMLTSAVSWFTPEARIAINLGAWLSASVTVVSLGDSPAPSALYVCSFLLGTGFGCTYPAMINFAKDRVFINARVASFIVLAGYIGDMGGPFLTAQLWGTYGPRSLFTVVLTLGCLEVFIFAAMKLLFLRNPLPALLAITVDAGVKASDASPSAVVPSTSVDSAGLDVERSVSVPTTPIMVTLGAHEDPRRMGTPMQQNQLVVVGMGRMPRLILAAPSLDMDIYDDDDANTHNADNTVKALREEIMQPEDIT